jgi:hypothetical protein
MCLILVRDPDVSLDYNAIKRAVLNNPHGFGYVIPDRGKLEIRRFFNEKGTDPDDVYEVLDEYMDKRIFLHLRYATAGNKDKNNVHPFPALQQRKHGMQAWLMHNGTLNEFSNHKSNMSDTFHFTETIVTPLLQRAMAYAGKKGCVQDPFVNTVIRKFAGWSKFVLVDNYGNYSIIGDGSQKKGYWASNDYSFEPDHREPETKSYVYKHTPKVVDADYEEIYKYRAESAYPFRNDTTTTTTKTESTALVSSTPTVGSTSPTVAWPPEEPLELEQRTRFVEHLGLQSLQDMFTLTEEDLYELIVEYPELMAVGFRDLLLENRRLSQKG